METTMKLAIETYSNLSGISFENIVSKCLSGDEVTMNIITKLMFCVA